MTVAEIMSRFGTLTEFANAVGVPTSTAYSWKDNDYIPAWRQPEILRLAHEKGLELSTTDFPPARRRAAA